MERPGGIFQPRETYCCPLSTWCAITNCINIALNFLHLIIGIVCSAFAKIMGENYFRRELSKEEQTPKRLARIGNPQILTILVCPSKMASWPIFVLFFLVDGLKYLGQGMTIYFAIRTLFLASLFLFLKKKDVKVLKIFPWIDLFLFLLGVILYALYFLFYGEAALANLFPIMYGALFAYGAFSAVLVHRYRKQLVNPRKPIVWALASPSHQEVEASGDGSARANYEPAAPAFNDAFPEGDQNPSSS